MKPQTVQSLLDLDFYKITMMQFFWKHFHELKVKYQFTNRSDIDLKECLTKEILEEEFDKIKELRFTECELSYLKTIGLFEESFIDYLRDYKLPNIIVTDNLEIYTDKNEYCKNSILWETIVLSAVNQLYYEHKYPKRNLLSVEIIGLQNLKLSLDKLKKFDIKGIVTDFGTRRRFSHKWQDKVCSYISKHNAFIGTSNIYFAKKYSMRPIGTNAHELYQILTGLSSDDLKMGHRKALDLWYEMYGDNLSIALSDTYGTDFFLEDFGKERSEKWWGVRQDSGDPFEFGEKLIKHYESYNIDPKTKMVVFSDGLDINKIIRLYDRFNGRIQLSFGWGTKLTNNIGYETLSIVMKAVEITENNGNPVSHMLVKLSDNLNKAIGSKEEIKRYKEVFGYTNTKSEKLIV